MIGFVTWPSFCTIISYKGGQVIKPNIVVKMLCKLLYIIQAKGFLTSWPYLISKILVTYNHLATMLFLIGLTSFTARLFLFSA